MNGITSFLNDPCIKISCLYKSFVCFKCSINFWVKSIKSQPQLFSWFLVANSNLIASQFQATFEQGCETTFLFSCVFLSIYLVWIVSLHYTLQLAKYPACSILLHIWAIRSPHHLIKHLSLEYYYTKKDATMAFSIVERIFKNINTTHIILRAQHNVGHHDHRLPVLLPRPQLEAVRLLHLLLQQGGLLLRTQGCNVQVNVYHIWYRVMSSLIDCRYHNYIPIKYSTFPKFSSRFYKWGRGAEAETWFQNLSAFNNVHYNLFVNTIHIFYSQ